MKKILLIAVMAIACVAFVNAQPRAIGVRLGGFDGVSYQHGFGESNMLEVEAGWGLNGCLNAGVAGWHGYNFQAAVTYDWIDPFGAKFNWDKKGEWHWYLGVGGAGGYGWHVSSWAWGYGASGFGCVGAAGRCGVEYDFWFPLQLSIDFRPVIGAAFDANSAYAYWDIWASAFGLSARYKF